MNSTTLIAGSYPPVPGPAAAATLGAVRRAWDSGEEVVTASPRPSAAAHVLPARGLARALGALARKYDCGRLVLCVEPGWPLFGRSPERQARALTRAFTHFESWELVVTGPPARLALDALGPLLGSASQVTVGSDQLAQAFGRVTFAHVRVAEPFAAPRLGALADLDAPSSVSPLEPGELLLATRLRRMAGRAFRRALGSRAPQARAFISRVAHR